MSERRRFPRGEERAAHEWAVEHGWAAIEDEAGNTIAVIHIPQYDPEQDIEAVRAERDRLRAALVEALEWGDEGWSYASDYFREKWDCAGERARIAAALAPAETEEPDDA